MFDPSWLPALAGLGSVLGAILLNRFIALLDRGRAESGEIVKARIDDGTVFRGEMWVRIEKLEAALDRSKTDNDQLRKSVLKLTLELEITRRDLLAAEVRIAELTTRLEALGDPEVPAEQSENIETMYSRKYSDLFGDSDD